MKILGYSGSTIVDASLVMPIFILAVVSVILISVFLMNGTFYQVSVHWELIDKEATQSKTKTVYQEDKRDYETSTSFINGKKYICIEQDYETQGGVLLPKSLKGLTNGRIYEINEKETIQYFDFFKGQIEQ